MRPARGRSASAARTLTPANGGSVRAPVKADAELAGIPVILFSGFPADAERAAAAGVRRHLVKPLPPERIVAAVDELCRSATPR